MILKAILRAHVVLFALPIFLVSALAAEDSAKENYDSEMAQAEELGKIIYEKDIAAWIATDKMLAELGGDVGGLPIRGWVTDKDGSHYRVNFIGELNGKTKVFYQAWTRGRKVKKSKVYKLGFPLTSDQMTMWKARKLVVDQKFKQCSKTYNTVIVPYESSGEKRLYVYLLASTTDPKKIVMGGHYRYSVSLNGEEVLSKIDFSNSCLELDKEPNSVGIIVTHLKTNYPQEHHVFLGLSHDIQLYVSAAKTEVLYNINNGKISKVQK